MKGKQMMKPLINWDEIQKLGRPPRPMPDKTPLPHEKQKPGNMWDNIAEFYNKMAMMELSYTVSQIDCLNITKEDTVLDMGCGPGRISILAAERAKSVTSADSAPKMLECCEKNAKERGITNLSTKFLDWYDVVPGENIQKHDIVIASRTAAMDDPEKLSTLANKRAGIVIWANGPSIPELVGRLFEGTEEEGKKRPPMHHDRRISYNITYNKIYDLGYEPNVRVLEDGFCKKFSSREEAYEFLLSLRPEAPVDKHDIVKKNCDKYLSEKSDGSIEFKMETRSCVIWWDTNIRSY